MSELKLTGTIKTILPVQSGTAKSGNDWQKQTFVITNNDGYEGKEQIFAFEVFGADKVENLTKYNKVGDNVEVSFNISTNEWKDKYFTGLQAWKIEKVGATTEAPKQELDKGDDLPF
tara:strand:+ start:453 stop:803 length:351 start_codon:yes stop_codon:yes gene_type:complete